MNSAVDLLAFRPASLDDVAALVALVTSAYRGDASRVGWTTEADILDGNRIDPDVLRADIQRARSEVMLLERRPDDASGPGGTGAVELLACAHVADVDGLGYFGMFAVRPDLQGTGIGHTVLAECERIARDELCVPTLRMTVIDVRDELIAWYVRRGYVRTGEFKPFPYGDERFGIAKREDLRFEVLEKTL